MTGAHEVCEVIDSHTGGEPTRVVVSGGPDLGDGPLAERRERLAASGLSRLLCNEPRSSPVAVGALLTPPHEPDCDAGVIFFNNAGPLGMCVHGTIGVVVTLAHLGRVAPGPLRLDTPVGVVAAELHADNLVTVRNVPAHRERHAAQVSLSLRRQRQSGAACITGDVAWGGNWFLLADSPLPLDRHRLDDLTDLGRELSAAMVRDGVTGADGATVDHVELFGAGGAGADARSFVMCPGGEFDRSPCGTGTSAKLACLAADGKLAPGAVWTQESILGSRFDAWYEWDDPAAGRIVPYLRGSAFLTGRTTVLRDDGDRLADGFVVGPGR